MISSHVIIGGGIVGLATARELAARDPAALRRPVGLRWGLT